MTWRYDSAAISFRMDKTMCGWRRPEFAAQQLIVTTNLKLEEIKNPPDLAHARIYDRKLERCAPVLFAGKNFREEKAKTTKAAAKEIISQK